MFLQVSVESIWSVLGLLDPRQFLHNQDSASDSTTTDTDSTVDSPQQNLAPPLQVQYTVVLLLRGYLKVHSIRGLSKGVVSHEMDIFTVINHLS